MPAPAATISFMMRKSLIGIGRPNNEVVVGVEA